MPLPEPQADETHDEFMDRCMSGLAEEYPDDDQRYAICEGQWGADKKTAQGQIERRFTAAEAGELRIEERENGNPGIKGLGAIYYDGTPRTEFTLYPGMVEHIRPGAFAEVLRSEPDVRALFNHDPNCVLGRTANDTMLLKSTRRGLEYDIEPADTQQARDVVALVRRGDVTGSSFSFMIPPDGEKWEHDDERDLDVRTIVKVSRLFDVGPVTFPAYEATEAALRAEDVRDKVWYERRKRAAYAAAERAVGEARMAADTARLERASAARERIKR